MAGTSGGVLWSALQMTGDHQVGRAPQVDTIPPVDAALRDRLTAALSAAGLEPDQRVEVVPAEGGLSATVHRIRLADRTELALRQAGAGDFLHEPGAIDREANVMRAVAAQAIPVPDVLATGVTAGTEWALQQWVPGEPGAMNSAPLSAAQFETLAHVLVQIHAAGTSDLPQMPMRLARLDEAIGDAPPPNEHGLRAHQVASAWRCHIDDGADTGLLHGDIWPGNLLWDGGDVTVIDWEGASIGSRWSDVRSAALEFDLCHGTGEGARLIAAYESASGLAPSEPEVAFWDAVAVLRLAYLPDALEPGSPDATQATRALEQAAARLTLP